MRRRIAHGLAILLSVASLGAAHGPNKSEASKTEVREDRPIRPRPVRSSHRPYQVGTASWYGDYFQGRPTASGEPFDMYELTAAHPTLPLGTWLRVTNLRNGRAVMVRVNDRGPIVPGRIIDLSYNAARVLGMRSQGLQRVRLDVVQPAVMAQVRQ